MTIKEFEALRLSIEREKFVADSDPITYGLERAAFEKQKFQRLIAAARQVGAGMKTVRVKVELWKRQLERANAAQERFEKMRAEIGASRRNFLAANPSPPANKPAP